MKLEVKRTGLVFEGTGEYQSALYPDICTLPTGRVIISFRAACRRLATKGQKIVSFVSDDQGLTWSESKEFFRCSPVDHGRPGELFSPRIGAIGPTSALAAFNWVDGSDTSRPYYNEETGGILDHKMWLSRTDDNGQTWSAPQPLEGWEFNRPTAVTAPPLRLPNGQLMCVFEQHKHYDEGEGKFFSGNVIFSADEGKTWQEPATVSFDPKMEKYYWDQRLGVIGNNVVALFWSYDETAAEYMNIHVSISEDNGRTWSDHRDTGVPGQPTQPVQLPDGRAAMAYIDRSGAPAIKLRISNDGGSTWPDATELTVFDSAKATQVGKKTDMASMWNEMYRFSIGFPSLGVLPDGRLMVTWYCGADTDHTAIMYALIG